MIKKIGLLLVLLVAIAAGIKGYSIYSVMQFVEKIKQEHGASLSLSYRWVSSDFDGSVHLEDIVLTPFGLKRTVEIERLTFRFGTIGAMLGHLGELKKGRLSAPASLSFSGLKMPFSGRGLDEWLALAWREEFLVPMQLFACDHRSRLDFSTLKAMGVEQFQASGNVNFRQKDGRDEFSLMVDVEKFGKWNFSFKSDMGRVNALLEKGALAEAKIYGFTAKFQDSGFNRRLIHLCTKESGVEGEVYADLSAKKWQEALTGIGVFVNDETRNLYRDRILQGGIISLLASPPSVLVLGSLETLYDRDLVSSLGLSVSLNGKQSERIQAYLDGEFYRPVNLEPQDKKDKAQSLQATVVLNSADFKVTAIDQLPRYLDKKIRVKLKDGKSYEGILKSANEHILELTLILGGGTADYFFANDKVEYVEVWR